MREILFRAKRKDTGEWVKGYYAKYKPCASKAEHVCGIVPEYASALYMQKIDPQTLCQYTGLTDKNGQRIWENDICKVVTESIDEEDGFFVVRWSEEGARFILEGDSLVMDFDNVYGTECEGVGNIFDNPELIEGEDDDRE